VLGVQSGELSLTRRCHDKLHIKRKKNKKKKEEEKKLREEAKKKKDEERKIREEEKRKEKKRLLNEAKLGNEIPDPITPGSANPT
jgi:hypothetical protein